MFMLYIKIVIKYFAKWFSHARGIIRNHQKGKLKQISFTYLLLEFMIIKRNKQKERPDKNITVGYTSVLL